MTLSELLTNIGTSFEIPYGLNELEVKMSEDVSNLSFYPWFRAIGQETLNQLHEDFDEYIYSHRIVCLFIEKDTTHQYVMRIIPYE